jgi:hypothetical protein
MPERRVQRHCDGDILVCECVDHGAFGLHLHVDVRTFLEGRYLGAWSIEDQQAFDGLVMTAAVTECLEQLTYKNR